MIIELPILGFLKERPMHGYEIRQRLETILGFTWRPSYGALYPMLWNLEKRGFIKKTGAQKGRGPQKQVYNLTGEGLARLQALLLSKPTPVGLPLQILFLDQLSKQERKSLLRQAQKQRTATIDRLEKERTIRCAELLSKYQLLVMDYGLETLRREIAWLEQLEQE